MTGADSPVIADSSTRGDALDDVAVAGDDLAGLDDHEVAVLQLAARRPAPRGRAPGVQPMSRRAMVSVLALRRVSACALPRPSATASARLAKTTVSHSQTVISPGEPATGR